jgi:hypothetical protein
MTPMRWMPCSSCSPETWTRLSARCSTGWITTSSWMWPNGPHQVLVPAGWDPTSPTPRLMTHCGPDSSTRNSGATQGPTRTGGFSDVRQRSVPVSQSWNSLRRCDRVLELNRRAAQENGHGWTLANRVSSAWQPSIAAVCEGLQSHIAGGASVADTLWWLVERFVLQTHERIAYSKLPEFTFRFRGEEGLLRFFDLGVGRFPLASIRMRPFGLLSQDIGLWERDDYGIPGLTSHGRSFVTEVFG